MKPYVFGVDLGGTTTQFGLFTSDGTLQEFWEIPTDRSDNGSRILPVIAEEIRKKRDALSLQDVTGVGIGVPGPVLADGTVVKCVNLGWGVFNVAEELGRLCQLPVRVGNDANLAALGEMWQGAAKEERNLCLVTLGTAVGGGVVLHGRIVYGSHGAAGEIGHIPVNEHETEPCGCGNYGCLEQYASASRFAERARKILQEHPGTETSLSPGCTTREICDAARAGDAFALERLDEFARILGRALAGVAVVLDPDVFLLAGGMSQAGDLLLERVRAHYVANAFHAVRSVDFRLAALANRAGVYGAARLMLDA